MAGIYYEKIDVEGHHFGPDSHQVKTAVQQLDLVMQTLNKKVKVSRYNFTGTSQSYFFCNSAIFYEFLLLLFFFQEMNMENNLNILLFSDHGMMKIQWMEKVIELDKYIDMSSVIKVLDRGPVVSLWPKEDKSHEVRWIN